jgi:hypothetical protein
VRLTFKLKRLASLERVCGGAAIVIISLLALAINLYANRFGANVVADSDAYITGGVRLAHGEGYSIANRTGAPIPQTWFPPLYGLVIAGAERLHLPIYKSIGFFDAACYALLVAAAGGWVWRVTASWFWSSIAAIAMLTNHAIYYVRSIVLSEPLFLLWITASLWCLAAWRRNTKIGYALLTGLCIAGGLLTRYAGISVVPAGAIVILFTPHTRFHRKLGAPSSSLPRGSLSGGAGEVRRPTPPNCVRPPRHGNACLRYVHFRVFAVSDLLDFFHRC